MRVQNLKALICCIAGILSVQVVVGQQVHAQALREDPQQTVAADAPSRHDALRELFEFNRRTLVDAYQKHGTHNPAWDREAQELLELFAVFFAYGEHEMPVYTGEQMSRVRNHFRPLPRLIAALEQSGCTDPLVLYLIGFHRSQNLGGRDGALRTKAVDVMSESLKAFEGSGYSAFWNYMCLTRCLGQARMLGFNTEAIRRRQPWHDQLSPMAIAAIKEISKEKSPMVRDAMVRHLCDPLELIATDKQPRQIQYLEAFLESLDPIKESDPWAYHSVRGTVLIDLAWMHRGPGFANQVKPEQWKAFERCLTQASDSFAAAWAETPSVYIANKMIVVAMGGHAKPGEDCRFWFERSVALMFDNPEAWRQMSVSLLPRWGGSHQQMMELAIEALNTGRFDTSAPEQFLLIIKQIDADRGDDAVWKLRATRDGLIRLTKGMAEQRGEETRTWYTLLRAAYMWKCGDLENTIFAIEEIGPLEGDTLATAKMAFKSETIDFDEAVGTSYALTSEAADEIISAFGAFREGHVEKAIASLTALRDKGQGLHPLAQSYLSTQISAMRFYGDFYKGEWVAIDRPETFASYWEAKHGSWVFDEKGHMVGQADENGLLLVFTHGFSGPWEMTYDFEFVEHAPEGWSNAGVIIQTQAKEVYLGNWVFPETSMHARRSSQWILPPRSLRKKIEPGLKYRFTYRHDQKGNLVNLIDEQKFYDHRISWASVAPAYRFGLSSTNKAGPKHDAPEGFEVLKVRFSNVKVRMLRGE